MTALRPTPSTRIGLALLLALSALLAVGAVSAKVLAGVELPNTVKLGGQPLALASCGVRDTLWVEHYVAALYLRRSQPITATSDPAQPKTILVHIIRSASLPARIPEEWREPLEHELKRGALADVRAAYGELADGDRVLVRYQPGTGVSMAVNGRVIVTAPGHGVMDSMLSAWADTDPVSGKLRRLTLDNPC